MIDTTPTHVAIIPDGNRRWAEKQGTRTHKAYLKSGSYQNISKLFAKARDLGVRHFSIWGFSTDNWKRSEDEKKAVFSVILKGIDEFMQDSVKEKIRFRHLGRKDRLPKELVDKLNALEERTKKYSDFNVNLCIDYGGMDEIVRTVNKIIEGNKREIKEEDFEEYLDGFDVPPLDLLIRTGGEQRTSGFLPWHSAYAEFYFTEKFFPEFGEEDLEDAISEYSRRKRRFGK